MERRVLLVDAFTDEALAGNAAGVVPDAAGLDDDQMQAIARELSVSETAFVLPSDPADRRLRYFTPDREVDLCGHATVGAHAALHAEGAIDAGEHGFETAVGLLTAEVTEDGTVWTTTDDPSVQPVDLGYDRLGEALGVDPARLRDVGADLPVAVAAAGLPFLVVPANFHDAVGGADPDLDAVAALCREVDAEGLYLFTFDTLSSAATVHGRAFVPLAGIDEDPVTGTASAAVGAYLHESAAFDDPPEEVVCEQGHYLDRPGLVRVRVDTGASGDGDDGSLAVRVGGEAVVALEGRLQVPETGDDEILEA
jgi:PhzF family phenazine biosynthesis protein